MQLLVTAAMRLTPEQRRILEQHHTVYDLPDERIPLDQQTLLFDPAVIEGVVCNQLFLHNSLDIFPSLRFVQLTSAGLDRVPLEEMRHRGIVVFNAGATYAVPMAEWAVAKVLEIVKCADRFLQNQREHGWNKQRSLRELCGMQAVIVGFGNVGKAIAKRLAAFDVRRIAVDIVKPDSDLYDGYVPFAEINDILPAADIVILTAPLTPDTRGMMNATRFALMKEDAVFVNIARGGLVDEAALLDTLRAGRLAGAALDVFVNEPLAEDHPLWNCERVLLSPHNSFVGDGNNERLFALVQQNIKAV